MTHTVLSVRQPWAGLLVAGVKRYELRTWRPKAESGWLLIHASAGKAGGMPELRAESEFSKALAKAGMRDESLWEQSAIIGAVFFRHFRDWYKEGYPQRLSRMDRFFVGEYPPQYLWEVGRAHRFETSVPCDGKLGLWNPNPDLTRTIAQRVRHDAKGYVKWAK